MPTTPNLGLKTWNENEVVDIDEVNENFTKLDNAPICIAEGTTTSSYHVEVGTLQGQIVWHYRKYSNNTVEMSAQVQFEGLRSNNSGTGLTGLYCSEVVYVELPSIIRCSQVFDTQMHLAQNAFAWIVDVSNNIITDHIRFRTMRIGAETDMTNTYYKQVYIHVKGVLATS